jgi:peptidoglycan/LPS O-acetylase OafA/YrhL
MSRNAHQQILGLDAIRFLAATLVFAYHLVYLITHESYIHHWGGVKANFEVLTPVTWFGWIGVQIFFTLSGFVITYSANGSTAPRFIKSRIVRLFPAAWICSTITLLVVIWCTHSLTRYLLGNTVRGCFMWPSNRLLDGSYWTLPIEIVFYALIAALLGFGLFSRLEQVMILLGLYSSTVSTYLLGVRLGWFPPSGLSRLLIAGIENYRGNVLLYQHGTYFAIGALLWLVLLQQPSRRRLLAIGLLTLGSIVQILNFSANFPSNPQASRPPWVPIAVWLLCVAAIVASVRWNPALHSFFKPAGARVLRILGLMTYPLYLLHQRIGYLLFPRLQPLLPNWAIVAVLFAGCLLASYQVAMYAEKALQSLLRKGLDRLARAEYVPVS